MHSLQGGLGSAIEERGMGDQDRDLEEPPQPEDCSSDSSDSAASSLSLVSRDLHRTKNKIAALESQVAFQADQIDNLETQRASLEETVAILEQRLVRLQETEARLIDRIQAAEALASSLERQHEEHQAHFVHTDIVSARLARRLDEIERILAQQR